MTEIGAKPKLLTPKVAVLRGFRLEFSTNWNFKMTALATPVMYQTKVQWFIQLLDKTEIGRLRPIIVQVEKKNGEIVEAITYQAKEEFVEEGLKPSDSFLEAMLIGKDIIPQEYAEHLRNLKDGK